MTDNIIGSLAFSYSLNGIGITIDSLHISTINRALDVESRVS